MQAAACVLVDGTFWTDDEMIRVGVSSKRAREIGHLPQSGAGGMLEWLERLPAGTRKILIHINNTNPILNEDLRRGARARPPRGRGRGGRHGDFPVSASSAAPWSREEFEAQLRRQGRRLPYPSSLQRAAEYRQGQPRADSRLGREPLLLPGQHSDQGCRHSVQLPGPRGAPQLGAAHPRSRRLRRGSRRHRFLAAAGGGGGTVARRGRDVSRGAARRAIRRRCVCQFRAPRAVAGGGVFLADRAVRPGDPQTAPRQLAGALSAGSTWPASSISRAA